MKKLIALLFAASLCAAVPARAQEFSDTEFCLASNNASSSLAASGPQWTDQVTRTDGIAVDCAGKAIEYKKFVKLSSTDMQQGWEDQMQQAWNKIYCEDPAVSAAIAHGWTVKVSLTLADDAKLPLTVECGQ